MFRLLMKTETKYGKFALDVDDVDRFLVNQHGFSVVFHIFFEAGYQLPGMHAKFHQHDELAAGAHQPAQVKRRSSSPW
jgi:hypothetical protein